MSNHLEQVVRPSQSRSIRPGVPTQIFATPKIPDDTPTVWGSSGASLFNLSASAHQEIKPAEWPEESRTYDVVRVYNDDKSSSVDTEQMTEYNARNKISGDRFTMRYKTNTNTENTEVISTGNKR